MSAEMRVTRFGDDAVGLRISGDVKKREPEHVRIVFPGGEVEVVRAKDGPNADYWVHLLVNHPERDLVVSDGAQRSRVTAARVDRKNHSQPTEQTEILGDPDVYHVAVRVTRDETSGGET